MALAETLQDNFDDGTVDTTKWPSSFGVITETGGRVRITCDTSYTGLVSDNIYSLQNSYVTVRAYPNARGSATTEAWCQLLCQTQIATIFHDIGMECDRVNGNLKMFLRNDYSDPTQTLIPYDATAHAWWRIRETGGTVFWDTSPDGVTWTNRKSQASPSWINDGIQELVLEAHRNNGTNDFAEFDNFNIAQGSALTADQADTEGLTDSLALVQAESQPISDSEGLTDSVAFVQEEAQSLSDSEGLTDSLTLAQAESDAFSDSAGLTDSLSLLLGFEYTTSDPLGLTDSLALFSGTEANPSDPLGLTDSVEITLYTPPPPPEVPNDKHLVMGPGTVYIGAYGAVEPALGSVGVTPDSGVWTDLGGILGGVELVVEQEFIEVELKQLPDQPMRRLKRRRLSIKTQLAETTLANLAYALNDTAAVTGQVFEPSARSEASILTYNALIVDGWAPDFTTANRHKRRRIVIRKCLSIDQVQLAYKKDGQSVYTVTWSCHYVDSVTPPFRVIDEA